jgi:tRNA threonylcarbamoyladenosine biosynthesis protein TsaB
MKVLGIDTSTACGSVGLIDEEWVVAEYLLNSPVTHSERLLAAVEFILKESRLPLQEIDGWAISLGPGSFTGLRIGLSTVKGLAFASGKPAVGVPTLDVLASQIAPTPYLICPLLDARKKEVYSAFYRYRDGDSPESVSAYQACRPEDLVRQVTEKTIFAGDGTRSYGDFFRNALPSLAMVAPAPFHWPRGSTVAMLGLKRLRKREIPDLASLTPIYVRASEAEIKWKDPKQGA